MHLKVFYTSAANNHFLQRCLLANSEKTDLDRAACVSTMITFKSAAFNVCSIMAKVTRDKEMNVIAPESNNPTQRWFPIGSGYPGGETLHIPCFFKIRQSDSFHDISFFISAGT